MNHFIALWTLYQKSFEVNSITSSVSMQITPKIWMKLTDQIREILAERVRKSRDHQKTLGAVWHDLSTDGVFQWNVPKFLEHIALRVSGHLLSARQETSAKNIWMACPLNKNLLTVSSGHWEGHVCGNVRPVCVVDVNASRRQAQRGDFWNGLESGRCALRYSFVTSKVIVCLSSRKKAILTHNIKRSLF